MSDFSGSALYSMPVKDAVVVAFGKWRVCTDRLWGVIVERRCDGHWESSRVDTIGL